MSPEPLVKRPGELGPEYRPCLAPGCPVVTRHRAPQLCAWHTQKLAEEHA